jgi:hypothetical protein
MFCSGLRHSFGSFKNSLWLKLDSYLSLAVLLALLTGCGTTTDVTQLDSQGSASRKNNLVFKTVVLRVISEVPNNEIATEMLDRNIGNELLLKRKQLVDSNGDVEVIVVIKDFQGVSKDARLWLASLAGNSRLRANITVKQQNEIIHQFVLDTEGKGASNTADWWSGEGGSTEDMLQKSAQRIIAEII